MRADATADRTTGVSGIARWLAHVSAQRPLLVTAVGGTECRLAVERVVRERGLRCALSPSEADTLVECGPAGSGVDEAAERVWDQMGEPRARVRVRSAEEAGARIDEARSALLDLPAQRRAAARRTDADRADDQDPAEPATDDRARAADEADDPGQDRHDHQEHRDGQARPPHHAHQSHDAHEDRQGQGRDDADEHGQGLGRGEHGGHGNAQEHGQDHDREEGDGGREDHSGHEGHAHHDHHSMELPGGLSMADRGDDRDGLRLDRLHIAIGPVQADWPAGLVLGLTVQGDVVQEAEVAVQLPPVEDISVFWDDAARETLDPGALRFRAAASADSLQRFLAVAGWPDAAATGLLLRDTLLVPEGQVTGRTRFTRWLRRVRRSTLLRWSLRGLGPTPGGGRLADPSESGPVPARLRGDAAARVRRWIDDIAAVLMPDTSDTFLAPPISRERSGPPAGGLSSVPPFPPLGRERAEYARAAVTLLPGMVAGQELAAVRLVVASLDPDLESLAVYLPEAAHD